MSVTRYEFANSTVIPANGFVLVVGFDPNEANLLEFTKQYSKTSATIVGPFSGNLSNLTERVALERPQASDNPLAPDDLSWIILDEVNYFDRTPWPTNADGSGKSLQRIPSAIAGSNPLNWHVKSTTLGYRLSVADFNEDGKVDILDLNIFCNAWLSQPADSDWNPACNLSNSGEVKIDIDDFIELAKHWLK